MCIPHIKLQNGGVSFCFVFFAKPEFCAIQRLFLEVNVLHNPKLIHELLQLPDEGYRHIDLGALWA